MKKIDFLAFRVGGLLCLLVSVFLVPNNSYAKKNSPSPKPIFKLIKGQGTEVCEAYLESLNKTEFLDNDPTKGRVSESLPKGFAELKTLPLTAEEIQRLYYKLKSFEQFQDQNLLEKYYEKYNVLHNHEKDFKQLGQTDKEYTEIIMDEHHQKPLVRYQEALDLDNDGKATDIVIKTTRDSNYMNIGLNFNGTFIVDTNLQNVEEFRMMSIFGDQEILKWPTITQFPPLVAPINLFVYQGKYYFAGFDNLAFFESKGVVLYHQQPMYLKVFIHENYQTKQVCDYEWINAEGTFPVYDAYD